MRYHKKNKICKMNKIYKPRYKRRKYAFIGSVEKLCEYYDDIDRNHNQFKKYPMVHHKDDIKEKKIVIPVAIKNLIINQEELSSDEELDKLSSSSDENDDELNNLLSTVDEQKLEEIISSMDNGNQLQGLLPTIIEADNEDYDIIDVDSISEENI